MIPKPGEILYDIGKSGRGKLSIAIGYNRTVKTLIRKLTRAYGTPSLQYYSNYPKAKLIVVEWVIPKGRKELKKVKKLLKVSKDRK